MLSRALRREKLQQCQPTTPARQLQESWQRRQLLAVTLLEIIRLSQGSPGVPPGLRISKKSSSPLHPMSNSVFKSTSAASPGSNSKDALPSFLVATGSLRWAWSCRASDVAMLAHSVLPGRNSNIKK